jgi:hypothetical protein
MTPPLSANATDGNWVLSKYSRHATLVYLQAQFKLAMPLLSQQTDFTMTLVRLQATNLPSYNTSTITDIQQTTPAHEFCFHYLTIVNFLH